MPAIDTGIIQYELAGQVLSTHFRSELFDSGPIAIADGNLIISDGFAGSLANAIDGGADYGFDISGSANLDIVEGVDSIKLLALVLEKQGKSPEDLFGTGSVGITIKDTVENIQALLSEPGLGLFDKIVAIDLVFEGEPPPIRVPLDKFGTSIDLSMFSEVTVFGTLEDYAEYPVDLNTITDPLYTFVVEDSLSSYKTGGFTADTGNLGAVNSGDYRVIDTLAELNATSAELSGSSFDGLTSTYGVVDTFAVIEGAYATDLVSLGVQSIVLEDTLANLSSAGTNLLPGDPKLDGIKAVDSYANLLSETFTAGFLPDATEVIAQDTAENISLNLALPPEGPEEFMGGKQLTGVEVTAGAETLILSFEDILELELSHLQSVGGFLELQATTAQLTEANTDLGSSNSILDRLPTLVGTRLVGVDIAPSIAGFLSTIPGLEPEVASALGGFDVREDMLGGLNTLTIDAAAVSDDAAANPYTPYTGAPLTFDAIDGATMLDIVGTAAVVADGDNFYPSNYVNTDPAALGGAYIQVSDTATAIRDLEAILAARDPGADTSFTIDGFMTDFKHEVSYADAFDAGADTILGTADDVANPLPSFTYASDWYELQLDVFANGANLEIGTLTGGDFEVSDSAANDVIDISAQTLVLDNLDTNPAFDFAFVDPTQLGSRTQTVDDKPAVDVSVEPGSTLIEFDGLVAGYDATPDFSITLNDVDLVGEVDSAVDDPLDGDFDDDGDGDLTDIVGGVTVLNFFGIPIIDQIVYDDLSFSTAITDLELLRFEAVDAYASAWQAFFHLRDFFYGTQDTREEEVDTLFNVEGDILIGDNNGDGPDVDDVLNGDGLGALDDDVIFGLEGTNTLSGLGGNDYIHGGSDNDTIMGGAGDDHIEDKWGTNTLYGDAGFDYIVGGDQVDFIYGGDDDDTIGGKFGDDVIYGDDGNDYIEGEGGEDDIFGGLGNDSLYGGNENDEIFGEAGDDNLYGNDGDDDLFGGADSDDIYGGDGWDELFGQDGNDFLYGGDDNDELYGEDGDDLAYGELGDDKIFGGIGIDTLDGGPGEDELYGGDDGDNIEGGDGNDLAYGGLGDDNVGGGYDDDTLYGDEGMDTLYGGYGFDFLYGGDDNDTLYGDTGDGFSFAGDDYLDGGAGADTLNGEDGDDTLVGGLEGDTLDGGDGTGDTVDYSAQSTNVDVNLASGTAAGGDTLSNIENATGGSAGDTITGSSGDNKLVGNDGDDFIYGGYGFDDIQGGAGIDTLHGDEGNDTISGGADGDTIFGGDGNDTISGDGGVDTIDGGIGNDTISGGDGADDLTGGSGMDVFTIAAVSEFGDIIRDFVTTTNPDVMEIARGALTGLAAVPDYGVTAGLLLTSQPLFFGVQGSTGAYGTAISSDGGFAQVRPDGPGSQQQVPVVANLAFSSFIRTNPAQDFADVFENKLAGLYAPTKFTIDTPNPAAFSTTINGDIKLKTGVTPPVTTFLATSVPANFFAFGVVRDTTGDGFVETAALVMGVVNNGPAGATNNGLNEIIAGEISVYTIAIFNPTDDAVAPQLPSTGDIFLV